MGKRIVWITTATIVLVLAFSLLIYDQYTPNLSKSVSAITGIGLNRLDSPMASATDDKLVYIANSNKHQISVFNLKGEYQYPIGTQGNDEGELQYPVDIEIYKDRIYVADLENRRIQIFSKDGQFLDLFPRERNIIPVAINVKNDKIYVSDHYAQNIKIYSLTGKLLTEFGENGTREGQLNYANGIAVSEDGEIIFVSDSQNQRIQLFSNEGDFLKVLPIKEMLSLPKGIALYDQQLFITDSLNQNVGVYDFEEKRLKKLDTKITHNFPNDVYISDRYVLVTEKGTNQIQILKRREL